MMREETAPVTAREPFATRYRGAQLGWSDYRAYAAGRLTYREYLAVAGTLLERLDAMSEGRAPWEPEGLAALATKLGMPLDERTDRRRFDWPEVAASWLALQRIAADQCPSAAMQGAVGLLGPWGDVLEVSSLADRRCGAMAMAAWSMHAYAGRRARSPVRVWERTKPVPSQAVRAEIRAITRAPWNAYRVAERDGDRALLSPLLPMSPAATPQRPVVVSDLPSVLETPGDLIVARVALARRECRAAVGFVLSGLPESVLLRRWLCECLLHTRLWNRRATVDDALRIRGDLLVCRLHEWAWRRSVAPDRDE